MKRKRKKNVAKWIYIDLILVKNINKNTNLNSFKLIKIIIFSLSNIENKFLN